MFLVQRTRMGINTMSRLIAFGCSFTYGQGLPYCSVGNNWSDFSKTPSEFAWPAKLGNLLDISVVNKGYPGASNIEILYHILNFKFEENDIAILMWSLPNRDLYFLPGKNKKKPFRQIGLWLRGMSFISNYWIKKIDEHDCCTKSWIYMNHAELYLKSKKITYIHYPAFPKELERCKPPFVCLDYYFDHGFKTVDTCINDDHPGINSHKETALSIYKILNDL